MGTALLIILCLILGFLLWLRRLWHRDPARLLRMIFRIPHPQTKSGEKRRKHTYSGNGRENKKQRHYGFRRGRSESIIPKEYAEDVEYVEIKEFTGHIEKDAENNTTYTESQVSDAEWVEIKK